MISKLRIFLLPDASVSHLWGQGTAQSTGSPRGVVRTEEVPVTNGHVLSAGVGAAKSFSNSPHLRWIHTAAL